MRAKNVCLICKQKIQKGQEVAILKNGIVIHTIECIDELKEYVKSIQEE